MFFILCIILFFGAVNCQENTERIKVLALSKAQDIQTLASWFKIEPSVDSKIVPTRIYGDVTREDIRRYMRIYYPRNYKELSSFEFFYLAQTDMKFFTPTQEAWLYKALSNGKRGGVNTRSVMSKNQRFKIPWAQSTVSEAFPNNADAVVASEGDIMGAPGLLVIKNDPELPGIMKPFKKELEILFPVLHELNTVPKPGSVILSYTRNNQGLGHPIPGQMAHVFYWRWNESVTFTFQDTPHHEFWNPRQSKPNPYAVDITVNIIWFSTGRKLPEDPLKVHAFRSDASRLNVEKMLLEGILDFAESFGADSSGVYEKMDRVEDMAKEAKQFYLNRDFELAYEIMEEAKEEMRVLQEDAAKLKENALTWVYMVEWLVTTGAFLISGFVLWTLMVRRSLYREIGETRYQ